ncbi:putative penicillin-binding protein [Xylogone sp. PMI_703]|nr:putative penicillin-binding protein [Xylogone sp. PMI_703]
MESFEEQIQRAIDQKTVVNAVLEAHPSYKYEKAFGKLSPKEGARDIAHDAVFWIASCTKLLTSICVLQCVQRGLITLDEPVSEILPEFAHPEILTNFDPVTNEPTLTKANNPITLRHLLTHTSGLAYPFSSKLLTQWRNLHPIDGPPKRDIANEYLVPLTFEPGEPGQWRYSVGLDWAGKLVERLNSGVRLGEYMEENMFKPLGIKDATFRLLQRKDMLDRLCPTLERQDDGVVKVEKAESRPIIEPIDDAGGGGLYTTAVDYIKVLESLLRDDGILLDSAMLEELFKPQLPDNEELQVKLNRTGPGNVLNNFGEKKVRLNHGLGGLVLVEEVLGHAEKGMLCWDGLPACFWWIDREAGTCGFYGSQLIPPPDRNTAELFGQFRSAIYNSSS